MPDLFIAPENKELDTIIMHKRIPPGTNPAISVAKKNSSLREIPANETKSASTPVQLHNPPARATSTMLQKIVKREMPGDEKEQSNSIPLFASFWQNPTGVYFDTQEINEHILLFLRRHPITNLGWIFSCILLSCLPPAVMYTTSYFGHTLILGSFSLTLAAIFFYYLIVGANAYANFLNWYYNISLITEKRVIDIELANLIGKKISATKITLVQDVNYEQTGTIRSIFDYGDVLIQTAGSVDNFLVHAVPKPEVVVRIVEDLIGEEGHKIGV